MLTTIMSDAPATLLYATMWSLSLRPLVSRGKYDTAMPDTSITVINIRMAAV